MTQAEASWVLDTSVVAPWFFTDEPLRKEALLVRRSVSQEPALFVVPSLFHSELLHVLTRKSGRDLGFVRNGLGLILRLGIRTIPLSQQALLRAAHWVCRGMSGYDATFVALAEDLGGRWLTADEPAARIAGRGAAETLKAWAARQDA